MLRFRKILVDELTEPCFMNALLDGLYTMGLLHVVTSIVVLSDEIVVPLCVPSDENPKNELVFAPSIVMVLPSVISNVNLLVVVEWDTLKSTIPKL